MDFIYIVHEKQMSVGKATSVASIEKTNQKKFTTHPPSVEQTLHDYSAVLVHIIRRRDAIVTFVSSASRHRVLSGW